MDYNEQAEILNTTQDQLTTIQLDCTRLFHSFDAIMINFLLENIKNFLTFARAYIIIYARA